MNPDRLSPASAAFALAASIGVLFNTALALAKDAYKPLNTAMAALTGHHWTTHAIADLIVFFGLGFLFLATGLAEKISSSALVVILVLSVLAAAAGLGGWYLFF